MKIEKSSLPDGAYSSRKFIHLADKHLKDKFGRDPSKERTRIRKIITHSRSKS